MTSKQKYLKWLGGLAEKMTAEELDLIINNQQPGNVFRKIVENEKMARREDKPNKAGAYC
jgi:hypothetical protein